MKGKRSPFIWLVVASPIAASHCADLFDWHRIGGGGAKNSKFPAANSISQAVETMSRRRDHHQPMVKKIPVAQRQRHQSWIRCVFLWCVCGLGLIDSFVIQDARRHFSAGRFAVSHQALSTIAGMNEHDKHNPSAYVDSYISQDDHALLIEALQAAGFTTIKTLTPTDDCCPCLHIDTHFPRLLICCG